jgi:hypothetical protein
LRNASTKALPPSNWFFMFGSPRLVLFWCVLSHA